MLEFAKGGELYKLLQAQGRLPEAQAAKYVAEVASALRFILSLRGLSDFVS